jgi:hypothetical protein
VSRKLLNVELYFLVRDIHPIEEDEVLAFIISRIYFASV